MVRQDCLSGHTHCKRGRFSQFLSRSEDEGTHDQGISSTCVSCFRYRPRPVWLRNLDQQIHQRKRWPCSHHHRVCNDCKNRETEVHESFSLRADHSMRFSGSTTHHTKDTPGDTLLTSRTRSNRQSRQFESLAFLLSSELTPKRRCWRTPIRERRSIWRAPRTYPARYVCEVAQRR